MIYDLNGNELNSAWDTNGDSLEQAYDTSGNIVWQAQEELNFDNLQRIPYVAFSVDESNIVSEYGGGYIEVQPDSWDGTTPVTGDLVSADDPTAWGFPKSLSAESKTRIRNELFNGEGYGVNYIRFPLGFGYRGYRNIDVETGLAKNIGERWSGQNAELQSWFSKIALAGGGLAPEYWCPAPYWVTGGAYYNADVNNYLTAGGNYPRTTTLDSIRTSDPTQYALQIEAFTDAIINDLEYLHTNIAPVRMFGLQGEPTGSKAKYGKMGYNSAQLYNDVLETLYPKLQASTILSTWGGQPNTVKIHVASSNETPPFAGIASVFIANHAQWIWGYSFDAYVTRINASNVASGAEFYKDATYSTDVKGNRDNVFCNEYEYFSDTVGDIKRCGNNITRLCYELEIGGANVIMPIIHVCKPAGQSSYDTNTRGYCLYAVDMETGGVDTNTWAYRSWKMFNDNLPIGAQILLAEQAGYTGVVVAKYNNKYIVLMGDGKQDYPSSEIVITFPTSKTFNGKAYSMDYEGNPVQAKTGQTIHFKVPGCCGIAWIEQ